MSNNLCLPLVNGQPDIEKLPIFLPHIGFRPLSSATPDDFPAGAVVVLYNIKTFSFDTVIVNGLSSSTEIMLFYARQRGRNADSWNNTFTRDTTYDSYLFKVIS